MKLDVQVKRLLSPDQLKALLATYTAANKTSTTSRHAWQVKAYKQYELHRLRYTEHRS